MSSDMPNTEESQAKLGFSQNLRLSLRMHKISLRIRPLGAMFFMAGAFLEIASFLTAIFATARLGAKLAEFATSGHASDIWLWLFIDAIATIFTGLGFLLMSYGKRLVYFAFVRWSTDAYMRTLCKIDLGDFYDKEMRNTINKVSSGYTWQIANLSGMNLDLLYGILRFLAITILVAQITWWIVPLIAIFLLPTLVAESRMAKMLWFVWDAKGDERHVLWGIDWILRNAKGQLEARATQATSFLLGKINSLNSIFYKEQEAQYRHASRLLVPTKIIEVIGTTIGSVVLLRQFLSHAISLERYFFLSGALLRIGGALNAIFGTLSGMQESLLFAGSYFELTDKEPNIIDKQPSIKITSSSPEIIFENISFAYPGQTESVFKNLDLKIASGEHVAIVGENGAGKSTLIKLLLRFYYPTSGRILIDGVDLKEVAIESWYEKLATLFQDFNQYPFSVGENITIGRSKKKPSTSLRNQAAQFGGVDTLTKKYKHGYDTVLDASFKKGIEPSGGQWQRVALARAFYRDAGVVILDEPTSAIDAAAEYKIFNSIFDTYKSRSAIIVSHRFSTVRRADRIVVLDQGKILEQGNHTTLMKNKSGIYHNLFSKQAEGYRD